MLQILVGAVVLAMVCLWSYRTTLNSNTYMSTGKLRLGVETAVGVAVIYLILGGICYYLSLRWLLSALSFTLIG